MIYVYVIAYLLIGIFLAGLFAIHEGYTKNLKDTFEIICVGGWVGGMSLIWPILVTMYILGKIVENVDSLLNK